MPGTMKDFVSDPTSPANGERQGSQPGNAAGAEIPVTVHASRYSAASKGAGKLPPVHEETRTVIIFPQGAVVRMAATVTPGELVVLTNNRTGADVICRVTNVKTQPGIQNYVHLEFTQRASDFWEEASGSGRGTSVGKPQLAPALGIVPTPPAAASVGSGTANSPSREAQPAAKTSAPAREINVAPQAVPKITPLADTPAVSSPEITPTSGLAQSQVSEAIRVPAPIRKQSSVPSPQTLRLQPFETVIPPKRGSSKTILLIAMAAAVVLVIGIVSGTTLLQRYRTSIEGSQVSNSPMAAAPVAAPAASEPAAPIFNASGKTNSGNVAEPAASNPAKFSLTEAPAIQSGPAQPAVETPKVEIRPQPVTRPTLNVGKIPAPRLRAAKQANLSEPPPVLPTGTDALPGGLSTSVSNALARPSVLPAVQPLPAAQPAVPAGGRLEQPRLIKSVAAVYPALARAQHLQGDVTIDALVDATGKVSATNVLTGNALLRKAAIDALQLWKYQPAELNGEPIPVHIKVTITFHLD